MNVMNDDPFAEITDLLRNDMLTARASITQSHALASRLGFDLTPDNHKRPDRQGSGSKGKSKPNLAGWLRRATRDGTLPVPTTSLIISKRMIQQGLTGGYIVGTSHPYRVTPTGMKYAITDFKGRLIQKG